MCKACFEDALNSEFGVGDGLRLVISYKGNRIDYSCGHCTGAWLFKSAHSQSQRWKTQISMVDTGQELANPTNQINSITSIISGSYHATWTYLPYLSSYAGSSIFHLDRLSPGAKTLMFLHSGDCVVKDSSHDGGSRSHMT